MTTAFRALTVPIDASSTAQHGIAQALEFAGRDTTLHFCSVVGVLGLAALGGTGALVDPAPMMQALEESAGQICAQAMEAAQRKGIRADTCTLLGNPADAISRFARESGSDAILLCTHARTGFARAFAGSVAEGVVVAADVPVIVTHEKDDLKASGPITVAVDGSPASSAALKTAIALAVVGNHPLSILHVVESDADWPKASDLLVTAAECARDAKLDFELVTLRGAAAQVIVESAGRRGSPMIVMGTRGRSAIARMLLGSVAEGVIENAGVPVVVVRHADLTCQGR